MENILGYEEHACSCDKCKTMCKKQACIGTPEDMLRIAKAGFSDKLASSYWLVGLMNRTHSNAIEMIAPLMTPNGCSFLDENNLCMLHDLGLKPTEGKLTNNHEAVIINTLEEVFKIPNYVVIKTWEDTNFKNIERRVFRK